ncbi:MAG: NUDIX domain-containing protein, partial [Alphaproteobacteria bacterium]|nr:NUDIX domain-containing protein [Alphaproteobacteria bacterium]
TYVITNQDGHVLLMKRPDKGLFSNMFIFPTTCFDFDPGALPNLTILKQHTKPIKHVFSHFDLELTVVCAETAEAITGIWVAPGDLPQYGMPTLMHKVTKALKITDH